MHIIKRSWKIPDGTQADVTFRFDQATPWNGKAGGTGNKLELTVTLDQLPKFMNEVRYSSQLAIDFPSGSEKSWVASMAGSNAAVVAMNGCISRILGNAPTQPFGRDSQPFGRESHPNAGPTQPFNPKRPAVPTRRPGSASEQAV